MPELKPRVVVYGKVVDDKDEGVYIESIYFGGIAFTDQEVGTIKRNCANNVRGGYAVTKTFDLGNTPNMLPLVFEEAKKRFNQIEKEMVENELVLEANNERSKKRR